jgi:hypothetical protein
MPQVEASGTAPSSVDADTASFCQRLGGMITGHGSSSSHSRQFWHHLGRVQISSANWRCDPPCHLGIFCFPNPSQKS